MAPTAALISLTSLAMLLIHRLPFLTCLQSAIGSRHLNIAQSDGGGDSIVSATDAGTPAAEDIECSDRPPPTWPSRLVVVQRCVPDTNSSMRSATSVTYYDSEAGANLIQITYDEDEEPPKEGAESAGSSPVLWDLELNDGSYYFYPGENRDHDASIYLSLSRSLYILIKRSRLSMLSAPPPPPRRSGR